MSKRKKKSFWGENVSEKSQINGMQDLINLTRMVESGGPLPDIDLDDDVDDSSVGLDVAIGLDDAVTRLMQKNNSGDMPDGYNPLQRVSAPVIPEVEPIHKEFSVPEVEPIGQEMDSNTIREMEPVRREDNTPAVKMAPPSLVKAEDVIDDPDEEEDDFEYAEKELEFSDFQLVYTDEDDDWIYVTNPYDLEHKVSFSTYNLRGYKVQKDKMYEMMLKYIPMMVALIAGPALIVRQDDQRFKKFMRSSIDRGINVDKTKFMIFTVGNNNDHMYMIYLIDDNSRKGLLEAFIPAMAERFEETDFFVQLATLALNPLINPYGMVETMWPGDRAAEELSSDLKVEEFINMMSKELGIEPVESSKTSYVSAEQAFRKKSVIGDIQQFLKTVLIAKGEMEKQMNPGTYAETFVKEESVEEEEPARDHEITTAPAKEEPVASDVKKSAEPIGAVVNSEESASQFDGLFDGVGEEEKEGKRVGEGIPVKEKEPEPPKPADKKPPKVGADGKRSNKRFEIPVQR